MPNENNKRITKEIKRPMGRAKKSPKSYFYG
jgi:hypothetical protein